LECTFYPKQKNRAELSIIQENPGIIALNETWLKEKDILYINNYTVIRKDRLNQVGGVLALCIKKTYNSKN